VSLFQALVLLLFNSSDELSLEELRTFTNIEVMVHQLFIWLIVIQYQLPVLFINNERLMTILELNYKINWNTQRRKEGYSQTDSCELVSVCK
jgi:hypothetical protein